MSGIVGIYYLDQQWVEPKDLHQMLDVLSHRGPDGSDVWCDGSIGLGHRMLWSTPESLLEKLPLERDGLVITADLRIDNRDELILSLALNSHPKEKITDSHIVLAAYKKWGKQCPEKLLGDFAFVIWDQHSQKIFCARDHFGIKPFYYYYQPGEFFIFASEIKAILCLAQIPQQLSEVRIGDYLTSTMADKAITTYKNVLRLPPAYIAEIDQQQMRAQCYWQLDPHREILLDSDDDYAQEFRKIFTEAVRCRLRSAFQVGTHLSGGLDSSSVTCVAKNLMAAAEEGPLHTVSIIFDEVTECDERPFIQAVLAQGEIVPHYAHGDKSGPLSDIKAILNCEDEAYISPNHFYSWIANRAASEIGIRVVLDGFDGDSTVSHGITRLTELARQGQWNTLIEESKASSELYSVTPYRLVQCHGLPYLHYALKRCNLIEFARTVQLIHHHFGVSRKRLSINFGLKPIWKQIFKFKKTLNSEKHHLPLADFINHDFAEGIGLVKRIQLSSPALPTTLRQEHWLKLTHGIFPFTLEQIDRYAAHFSLEARHPFMDKRLIEFCLALPAEQKMSQGFGRVVMRRALSNILPETIQWRMSKADFSPNFDYGLLNSDRKVLDQIMSEKIKYLEKYINIKAVQAAYQRMISAPNQVSNDDSITVWKASILALWMEGQNLNP
jgi:asparagine synthase (glutamine-hydrolysing)